MNPHILSRAGRKIGQGLPMMLCVIGLAGLVCAPSIAWAAETGIRGIAVWGPLKPGPTSAGQGDEAPVRASFIVYKCDEEVARFESDSSGSFEVSLPPGSYVIIPDKRTPVPYPEGQKTRVTVPKDGFAVVTIRLDTGMR